MVIYPVIGTGISALAGTTAGYFGKCSSGKCLLTANPLRGAIFGVLFGALFAVSAGCGKSGSEPERVAPQASAEITEQKQAHETKVKTEDLIHVNSEAAFKKEVLAAQLPCLADFFSLRCPPCKMLNPIIKKLAQEYKGRAVICKVSLDNAGTQGLPQRYGIRGIPTVIFFNKGQEIKRLVGLRRKEAYAKILDELIKTKTPPAKDE